MMEREDANGLEDAPCPRCGCEDTRTVVTGIDRLHHIPGEYRAAECLRCGLWFQRPRPTVSRLASLYPNDYSPHQAPAAAPIGSGTARFLRKRLGYRALEPEPQTGKGSKWRQLAVLDWIRNWQQGVILMPTYVAGGKLLEIGCASGGRLLTLHRLGWQDIHGIELVPAAAERARAEGLSVTTGQVEDALSQYPDGEFDVVIASMVLEHLHDPYQVLKQVARKLKPGGQFVASTVVRDGLDARMFRDYWSGFDFPRHMVYFRKSDLLELLESSFEKIELFYQSAPIDFVRPAVSRKNEGKGTAADDAILWVARSSLAPSLGLCLAWLHLTSRISFRCQRRCN